MNSVSGLCLCLRDTALKLTCHFNRETTSQGRGRRGRPRDTSQAPPVFDQQAFVEVVGIAAAAIAQAGIAGSQGGPSNLQRFRAHHPPIFTGGGDPMVADHWFIQVEKVLEAMKITSDATRIRLSVFQLEGEAQSMVEMGKDL